MKSAVIDKHLMDENVTGCSRDSLETLLDQEMITQNPLTL